MRNIFLIASGLCLALLVAACSRPPLPPAGQQSAGAPAEQPEAPGKDMTSLSPQGWEVAFEDSFPNGQPKLRWLPYPFFNQDNLRGGVDPTSPARQQGVGILTNEIAGGFAALSYAEAEVTNDFRIETWVYTNVTKEERGPFNGIAFRVDPVESRYFRFASHFVAEPSLSLAYVGQDVQNFPVFLSTWEGEDIPEGPPMESGWHRMAIEVVDNKAEVYWDSQKLPGGPFAVDRIPSGYVGAYVAVTGGLGVAETKVADLVVFRPAR